MATLSEPAQAQEEKRVSDYLESPPVVERLMGDLKIHFVNEIDPRSPNAERRKRLVSRSMALRRVTATSAMAQRLRSERPLTVLDVVASPAASSESHRAAVADAVTRNFWENHFARRDNRLELIPLTRERFLKVGREQLLGASASDTLGSAWWRVRMDLPLTQDWNYHLILSDCYTESLNLPYGHFAIGLRRRGGDLENDLAIDPRAPRKEKESPALVEYINVIGNMINGVHTSNLWDWYHTQVQYRDITLKMQIVSLSREQATLLSQLAHRDDLREVAAFRVANFNCATLGVAIMDALLPFDRPVQTGEIIANAPGRGIRKTVERFPFVTSLEIMSETIKNGRELTSCSDVLPPPDRENTMVYRILSEIPEIN